MAFSKNLNFIEATKFDILIILAIFIGNIFEQTRSSLRGFFSSSNSAIKSEAVLRRPTTKDVLAKKVHLLQTTKKSH